MEIEQIRGVNSDYSIQMLLQHNLIEVVGRKDAVGKPLLYGTTEEFLKRFGLEDIDSLPDYEEILDRIKVVHRDDNSLYRTFDIPTEDEEESNDELPKFLEGEDDIKLVE